MSTDVASDIRRLDKPPATMRPPVPWGWVALCGAVVAGWAAVAAAGGLDASVGGVRLAVSPGGAAAAAGAALLAGTEPVRRGWGLAAVLAGLLVLPSALALAASGGEGRPLIALLPAVVGLGVAGGGRNRTARIRAVALAGIGTALLGAAVFSGSGQFGLFARTQTIGATLVAAGVLLVIAGAGGSIGVPALKPLLVVGMLVGVIGAAALPDVWVPLLVGAAAVGISGVRPAPALALFAIALGALPGGQPAASLLGAAAVLAIALDRDWAMAAALPGAVALVEVLMFPGALAPRVVTSVVAVLLSVQIARDLFPTHPRGPKREEGSRLASTVDLAALPGLAPRRAERHRLPALVLLVWLLVAPASWTWAGDAGIDHYDVGAGRAVAVAGLVLVALAGADQVASARRLRMVA